MNRQEVTLLFQLINSMNSAVDKAEQAYKDGNYEALESAKRELMGFQRRIKEIVDK